MLVSRPSQFPISLIILLLELVKRQPKSSIQNKSPSFLFCILAIPTAFNRCDYLKRFCQLSTLQGQPPLEQPSFAPGLNNGNQQLSMLLECQNAFLTFLFFSIYHVLTQYRVTNVNSHILGKSFQPFIKVIELVASVTCFKLQFSSYFFCFSLKSCSWFSDSLIMSQRRSRNSYCLLLTV